MAFESFIYFDYLVTTIAFPFYHFAHKDKKIYIPLFWVYTYVILNRWNFTSPSWTWNVVSFILINGTFIFIWWMLRWTASIVIFRQCQRYFFVFYFSDLIKCVCTCEMFPGEWNESRRKEKIVVGEEKKKIRNIRKFYFILFFLREQQQRKKESFPSEKKKKKIKNEYNLLDLMPVALEALKHKVKLKINIGRSFLLL